MYYLDFPWSLESLTTLFTTAGSVLWETDPCEKVISSTHASSNQGNRRLHATVWHLIFTCRCSRLVLRRPFIFVVVCVVDNILLAYSESICLHRPTIPTIAQIDTCTQGRFKADSGGHVWWVRSWPLVLSTWNVHILFVTVLVSRPNPKDVWVIG